MHAGGHTYWFKLEEIKGDVEMKKFSLAAVGFAALAMAAPASAADMAVKAPPPAPVIAVYNWSGFYIGANGGWGQSRNCWGFVNVAGTFSSDGCADRSGGLVVFAGTLNPHVPRQLISSSQIHDWLADERADGAAPRDPDRR